MTKKAKPKQGIARLLEISGEKRTLLTFASIFSVISAFIQLVPFASVYFIVAEILAHAAAPLESDTALIQRWGGYALLALAAALITQLIAMICSHIAAFRVLYNLRVRLCNHLAALPLGYHTRKASGAVKKVIEMSVEKVEGFIAHQLPDFAAATVVPFVILIALFLLDWRMALACLLPIIFSYVIQFSFYYSKNSKIFLTQYQNKLEEMNGVGVEYIRGMPAIKVFGLTVSSFLAFRNSIGSYKEFVGAYARTFRHPFTLFTVLLTSLSTFVLPIAVLLLDGTPQSQALALTLVLFILLLPGLATQILRMTYLGGDMKMISEGVGRIDAIFAEQPISEPQDPKTPADHTIVFKDVSFSYQGEEEEAGQQALSHISFTAAAGSLTALVGPSGSGKSTVGSLCARFWDVDEGQITVGGIDIRGIGTQKLMENLSFVLQETHLFFDSVEANIRMGNEAASLDEVIAAARAACCHDFIGKLPQGYNTRIGAGIGEEEQSGVYLSGGEVQRICIARAILKNAPILILDEATAYADPENEEKIERGLSTLIQNKTVIVIAHRLSTIKNADRIIVLNQGKIEEQGNHGELFENKGLYSRMWQAHISAEAWELTG